MYRSRITGTKKHVPSLFLKVLFQSGVIFLSSEETLSHRLSRSKHESLTASQKKKENQWHGSELARCGGSRRAVHRVVSPVSCSRPCPALIRAEYFCNGTLDCTADKLVFYLSSLVKNAARVFGIKRWGGIGLPSNSRHGNIGRPGQLEVKKVYKINRCNKLIAIFRWVLRYTIVWV